MTGNDNLASVSFVSDSQYELTRNQPCDPTGANECFESGVFTYASGALSLTSDDTKETVVYDVTIAPADTTDPSTQDLLRIQAGSLTRSRLGEPRLSRRQTLRRRRGSDALPARLANRQRARRQEELAPFQLPVPVQNFLKANDWGTHHLAWHTARQWDLMNQPPKDTKDGGLAPEVGGALEPRQLARPEEVLRGTAETFS